MERVTGPEKSENTWEMLVLAPKCAHLGRNNTIGLASEKKHA